MIAAVIIWRHGRDFRAVRPKLCPVIVTLPEVIGRGGIYIRHADDQDVGRRGRLKDLPKGKGAFAPSLC